MDHLILARSAKEMSMHSVVDPRILLKQVFTSMALAKAADHSLNSAADLIYSKAQGGRTLVAGLSNSLRTRASVSVLASKLSKDGVSTRSCPVAVAPGIADVFGRLAHFGFPFQTKVVVGSRDDLIRAFRSGGQLADYLDEFDGLPSSEALKSQLCDLHTDEPLCFDLAPKT